MKNTLLNEVRILIRQGEETNLIKAQQLLMNYLKNHVKATDIWLLLIRIEWNTPLEDPERIVEYVNNIFLIHMLYFF